jgi:hypothetical protein
MREDLENPLREEDIDEAFSLLVDIDDITGENTPKLKPELIGGVLRKGHTMQITARSKMGKSWMLEALCVAFANGVEWMGHTCAQSRVLFVDTEIDEDTLGDRFNTIKERMGCTEPTDGRMRLLSLRGKDANIGSVAEIARRASLSDTPFDVVILDSLYSFETGDENSVTEMRPLMQALNRMSTYGCSVIWSHHHAKGAAGSRDVVDRGAGSGIFGRSPDALIDLTEIAIRPDSDEEAQLAERFEGRRALPLRVSYVLREFPDPGTESVVFDWPLFVKCPWLDECPEKGSTAANAQAGSVANSEKNDDRRAERDGLIADALARCARDGVLPTRRNVYERGTFQCSESTFRNWTKRSSQLTSYYADEDNMIVHE